MGAAVRAGEGFAGESPLYMATTLVAAVRGDEPSHRCDGRPGPPDSSGPVKWAWVWVGFGLEVLGKLEGFRWVLGLV